MQRILEKQNVLARIIKIYEELKELSEKWKENAEAMIDPSAEDNEKMSKLVEEWQQKSEEFISLTSADKGAH